MLKLQRNKRLLWPTLFTLTALAVLIGLGNWQMQRKVWKEELIRTINQRSTGVPLPSEAWLELPCERSDRVGIVRSCDYTAVRLRGHFDHASERHVFASIPGQHSGVGGVGYWIFTPFRLTGLEGRTVVNRGFVPHERKDAATRAEGQVVGEVEIVGLFRTAEVRGWFDGKNDEAGNVWYVRDPTELFAAWKADAPPGLSRRGVGGLPDPLVFYIDQLAPVPRGGLPLPIAPRVDLPNRHLEYAITWYGLAATLIGVYVAFATSRLRGSRSGAIP